MLVFFGNHVISGEEEPGKDKCVKKTEPELFNSQMALSGNLMSLEEGDLLCYDGGRCKPPFNGTLCTLIQPSPWNGQMCGFYYNCDISNDD
jgi:hypothetical protein